MLARLRKSGVVIYPTEAQAGNSGAIRIAVSKCEIRETQETHGGRVSPFLRGSLLNHNRASYVRAFLTVLNFALALVPTA